MEKCRTPSDSDAGLESVTFLTINHVIKTLFVIKLTVIYIDNTIIQPCDCKWYDNEEVFL